MFLPCANFHLLSTSLSLYDPGQLQLCHFIQFCRLSAPKSIILKHPKLTSLEGPLTTPRLTDVDFYKQSSSACCCYSFIPLLFMLIWKQCDFRADSDESEASRGQLKIWGKGERRIKDRGWCPSTAKFLEQVLPICPCSFCNASQSSSSSGSEGHSHSGLAHFHSQLSASSCALEMPSQEAVRTAPARSPVPLCTPTFSRGRSCWPHSCSNQGTKGSSHLLSSSLTLHCCKYV